MFNFFFKIFSVLLFLTFSVESKNFNNTLIKGNKRISAETILLFSEIPIEEDLDENSINLILKNLYDTGFFSNVNIKLENSSLIIEVMENPIIQSVLIKGIKRNKTVELINEVLSLRNRSSFNSYSVKKDEISILNLLKEKNYFFSTIITSTEDLGDNKVNLIYEINLGNKAKISKISFLGDKKFKDGRLKGLIISEEYKFWKFISGKKFLNETLIDFDKKLLNNFYRNKGYFDVKIESSYANYLGNDEFELIYNISSGKKYYFNNLSLNLPDDYNILNFAKLEKIFKEVKGEAYSLNSIDDILKEIDKIVLNEQYEFLKSTVTESINDNLINLTFNITQSDKYYVEKINIFGNNVTQEQVIRNNFLVDEGDAFNELLYAKTLNQLRSLNYFKNVNADILEGSSIKQKIINIKVEEKPTGEIMAGAGVGTGGGTVGFSLKENNFLGRGIELASDLSLSAESTKGLISLNNPNFKGTNRSLNLSLQSTVTDRLKNFGYESNKTGFSIGSGFEYYNDLFLNLGISSYVEKLETDSTATANLKKNEGSYFDTYFNYTVSYDKRNVKFKPSDGYRSRFTQNIPLLSDTSTLKNTYDYKFYNEWFNENIASFSLYAATTNSINGKDVKLSDRLFIPSKRLRGFESGRVGPKDGNDFIGGNYAMSVNLATTVPQILKNFQNTNVSVFFDAANVWGVDYSSSIADGSQIRSSVGLAVDFLTPIGPLNFSLSEPITKSKNDITEAFRFNLGTTF